MSRRQVRPVVRLRRRDADKRPELRRAGNLEQCIEVAVEYVLPREGRGGQGCGEFEFIGGGGSNNFAKIIILMAAELLEQLRLRAVAQLGLALERRRRRGRRALLLLRWRRFEGGGVARGGGAGGRGRGCSWCDQWH